MNLRTRIEALEKTRPVLPGLTPEQKREQEYGLCQSHFGLSCYDELSDEQLVVLEMTLKNRIIALEKRKAVLIPGLTPEQEREIEYEICHFHYGLSHYDELTDEQLLALIKYYEPKTQN